MKRMRSNLLTLKTLLFVTVLAMVIGAAFTVSANTLTETSMTYDFTTYTSNNDAILNGWKIEGETPEGTTKNGIISVSGGFVGAADYVTRDGAGLYENFSIVYNIPASERINLAEYDFVSFTRKLLNYEGFLVSGAKYAIVFATDKGDSIRVEQDWVNFEVTPEVTEIEIALQEKFESVSSAAKLTSITFIPYVGAEDFRPDTAVEQQLLIQFLVSHVEFKKAVDLPVVEAVEDTYDGFSVTEHNGKITGLNPAITYEYKLTYDTEWTTVSGATEITGLTGAAYLLKAVADEGTGLLSSQAITVSVPKTLKGGVSYTTQDLSEGKFSGVKNNYSKIGWWTSRNSTPYNAANRITISSSLDWLIGKYGFNGRDSVEGAYYRREILRIDYALTPEEQIDFSVASLSFDVFCSANFPYLSYQEVSGIMEIYVAGYEEPIVIKNIRHTSGDRAYSYNLSLYFPDVKGYIERISYYPFYYQDSLACYTNNYPQMRNVVIKEILPAPKPSVFVVDMEDGNYKISGLKSSVQYEMSTDEGETWTLLDEKINSVAVPGVGTYWIRQVGDRVYFPGIPAVINIKSRRPGPSEVTLSGTSLVGLNPESVYEYATYSIAGDMEFTKVTGVTRIDGITPGIWCIRYAEDESNFASNFSYLFLDGSTNKGKVSVVAQPQGSPKRGFETGVVSSDVRAISYYTYKNEITPSLVMWSGWEKTTDMSYNATLNVKYAFEHDQAFDIKQLYRFYYKAGFQGSGLYLNNGSLTGFYNKIRIYVVNSDVEFYEVYSPWNTTNKTTFNIGAALPANAHGIVVGYEFFYYGMWPEISSTMKSGYPYPLWTIYDLGLSSKVAVPKPTARYNPEGNFTIYGLSYLYSHGYSTDGKTFVELPRGTTSFNVKSAGTYYVYAQNTSGMKSELAVVEVQVDGSAAVTGLSVSGDTIEGFNTNLLYEYRKYSLTDPVAYTKLAANSEKLENLEPGIWEIRYVTENNDGKPGYYAVYGDRNGTIDLHALYMSGGDKFDGNTGFAQGRWTSSSSTCYLDSCDNFSKIRLATNWNSSLNQSDLDNFYFSYQLADDQIVSASDVNPFSFYVGFGNAYPYSNPSTTRVRFYVVGSDVEYYDVLVENSEANAVSTADLLAAHPDATGFVVALRIYPFASFPEGTTLADTKNRYPVMKVYGEASGSTDPRYMVKINLGLVRPQGLKFETVNANLYQIYKITGLHADENYEYSYNGSSWITVPAGSTEIGPIVGGTYYVRYAATSTKEASEAVELVSDNMTPAFIKGSISYYPQSVGSTTFIEGFWTCKKAFETLDKEPTIYINPTMALNTVEIAYTFNEEHRFAVNEYPIFTFDFNNEMFNLGFANKYITNAIAKVDIYFTDSDTPYTITKNWAGYTYGENGTPNRILVDLIAADPELSSKTVRAFVIKPYSNITNTPADYNTSASGTHYIYFRMFNVGFYSTMDNVSAIYSADNQKVNEFSGIRIENVPERVNVGDAISSSAVKVIALYSDGKEEVLNNAYVQLDIPDIDKAGIFTVTASYRGASATAITFAGVEKSSIEINTLPDKLLYYVGEMFDPTGLSFKYVTSEGNTVLDDSGYVAESMLFEAAGVYELSVVYSGKEFTVEVKAIPVEDRLVLDNDAWTFDADSKKLRGVPEKTTVGEFLNAFTVPVRVYDRAGTDVTENTSAYVGTGFTVATVVDGAIVDYATVIVKGDVNGNGRIDTNDYMLVKRAYINAIVISDGSDTFEAADVNGNGFIDSNDYLRIKNHYRGALNLFN